MVGFRSHLWPCGTALVCVFLLLLLPSVTPLSIDVKFGIELDSNFVFPLCALIVPRCLSFSVPNCVFCFYVPSFFAGCSLKSCQIALAGRVRGRFSGRGRLRVRVELGEGIFNNRLPKTCSIQCSFS